MQIIRDPGGARLARIEYDKDGYPTGRLYLSNLTINDVRTTSVPSLLRYGNDLFVRVRVVPVDEERPSVRLRAM